ncbi:MAG: beta-galactosidase [Clostridia bacterium]|nr:beta-galactosidase [Clostridia bacterium]
MKPYHVRMICVFLCMLMLCMAACQADPVQPQEEQSTQAATTEELTSAEQTTEELTSAEQTTEEEPVVKEPRNVGQRYFIYRIWNFTPMTQAQFEAIVDAAAQTGFNAIKVHIPWSRVEAKTAGEYDFSAFDPMIEYVVKTKGLKVAISIDLTRRADDKVIGLDQMMYDPNGNLCKGGSIDGMRTMISFCSESAVNAAVAFYSAAVERYEAKYASDVLFYLPAFSQYAESEYWCAGEYDYSDLARARFYDFLIDKYKDINALNAVLGTDYTAFGQIELPSTTASDNLGQLWYQFRHQKLKQMIDALAVAQKQINPESKYALQFGAIHDAASLSRGTLAAADLAELADVVWIDDGPNTEHEFSLDYSNGTFAPHIMLAQEIDGPRQTGATPEKYLDQGMDAYTRGCTYLSIANWSIDQDYRNYEWVWKQLIDTWFGDHVPEVIDTTRTEPAMEISLTDLLRKGNPGAFITSYYALAKDGEFVNITVKDDLSDKVIDQPNSFYAFPSGFSTEQGKGNWYYMSYHQKRGQFTEMTWDAQNARWQGKAAFTLIAKGSMHPDSYDAALVFEAPMDGVMQYKPTLSIVSDQSDGIMYAVLKNGEPLLDGKDGYVLLLPGEVYDGVLEIEVKKGDCIALVINMHKNNAFDSTSASVIIEYYE